MTAGQNYVCSKIAIHFVYPCQKWRPRVCVCISKTFLPACLPSCSSSVCLSVGLFWKLQISVKNASDAGTKHFSRLLFLTECQKERSRALAPRARTSPMFCFNFGEKCQKMNKSSPTDKPFPLSRKANLSHLFSSANPFLAIVATHTVCGEKA